MAPVHSVTLVLSLHKTLIGKSERIERIFHPKKSIIILHPDVIPNLHDFLSSPEHKRSRFVLAMKVNGVQTTLEPNDIQCCHCELKVNLKLNYKL